MAETETVFLRLPVSLSVEVRDRALEMRKRDKKMSINKLVERAIRHYLVAFKTCKKCGTQDAEHRTLKRGDTVAFCRNCEKEGAR